MYRKICFKFSSTANKNPPSNNRPYKITHLHQFLPATVEPHFYVQRTLKKILVPLAHLHDSNHRKKKDAQQEPIILEVDIFRTDGAKE